MIGAAFWRSSCASNGGWVSLNRAVPSAEWPPPRFQGRGRISLAALRAPDPFGMLQVAIAHLGLSVDRGVAQLTRAAIPRRYAQAAAEAAKKLVGKAVCGVGWGVLVGGCASASTRGRRGR